MSMSLGSFLQHPGQMSYLYLIFIISSQKVQKVLAALHTYGVLFHSLAIQYVQLQGPITIFGIDAWHTPDDR